MFHVLVAAEPLNPFSARVARVLRHARLRVISCELAATQRPPSGASFDAAVACAELSTDVGAMARVLRASLDGSPPVVGVAHGPTALPPGTVDMLADDASDSLVVASVQRAAASRERVRSRTILSGDLGGVGLRALLLSLGSRGRSGVLRVRTDVRRAELSLEGGVVVHAQILDQPTSSLERVVADVETWMGAVFELIGATELPSPSSPPAQPRSREEAVSGSDSDVALAAAVMNAVAAYASAFLLPEVVMQLLEESRQVARATHPGVDAFTIAKGGMVSVTRVSLARGAVPDGLGAWCTAFLAACRPKMPVRLQHASISEVLGGLTRLIEKVGWSETVLRAEKGRQTFR
jgi:hypothetical protein